MAKKTAKAAEVETPAEAAVETQTSAPEVIETTETKEVDPIDNIGRTTELTKAEIESTIERLKKTNPAKYEIKRAELETLLKNAK